MNSDHQPDLADQRLGRLRGRALPLNHNARTISALAANPGCSRRALMDAAGVDKQKIAAHVGYPAPFGQSRFAITRGNAFEAQVKDNGAAQLLTLLREHLGLDVAEVAYTDLGDIGGNPARELRHVRTRHGLTGADHGPRTLFDHPLLRLRVGGRHAYLEPDLIALRLDGSFHVIEIKSFPVIDGQADPAKVASAAIQSAVYVRALRDLITEAGGDPGRVSHQTILIAPRDFASQPVATSLDVRRQLGVLDRQLVRLAKIEDLLDRFPETLTFDLDPGEDGTPRRPPEELTAALTVVPANYSPECLGTCELCFACRDEAAGSTGALGKSVREDLGGIEYDAQALALARGQLPSAERAEIAAQLLRAAQLREQLMGEVI
ncbi:MAG TPA: hypothetical protein VGG83_19330 [Trebonia sp.]